MSTVEIIKIKVSCLNLILNTVLYRSINKNINKTIKDLKAAKKSENHIIFKVL